MPFCTSCGAPRPERGRFCPRCGAPFSATRTPPPVDGPSKAPASALVHPPVFDPPARPDVAAPRGEVPTVPGPTVPLQDRGDQTRSVTSSPSPRARRARRTVRLLLVVSLVGGMCAGGYLRYTSTTCQLRRVFAVADWTCG